MFDSSKDIIKKIEFYKKIESLDETEIDQYKIKVLDKKCGGKLFKFIQFDQNMELNKIKLDTLYNNKLWFGCPWTMNDSTEFKMPSNLHFKTSKEAGYFRDHCEHLYEMYVLCSFSIDITEKMWNEYAVTGKEEIVADRDVEIPGMEEQVAVSEVEIKKVTDFEDVDTEICREKDFFAIDERSNIKKEQTDVHDAEPWKMDNGNSKQICGGESRAEDDEAAIISRADDKVEWIADRLSGRGAYENIDVADKAAIFGFDIADISGSISVFTDVMKRLGIKLVGDELYEEFQRIYDESVGRVAEKGKAEDKMWNRGRGR